MEITRHAHLGYRPWLAQITGTSKTYGFEQAFVRATERDMSRSGRTGTYTWEIDEPGLYRVGGTKEDNALLMLWRNKEGQIKCTTIDQERAKAIAQLLDEGEEFEAARQTTRPVVA